MIDGDFTFKEDLRNFPDLENLLDPRQKESKSLNIEIVLIWKFENFNQKCFVQAWHFRHEPTNHLKFKICRYKNFLFSAEIVEIDDDVDEVGEFANECDSFDISMDEFFSKFGKWKISIVIFLRPFYFL